ncbi:MAG: ATP-binding protein [Pseudolabrys sp.]
MRPGNLRLNTTSVLPVVAIVLAACIFIADTITNLEIAFPAFYTAIILIAARFCKKRGIALVGAGCIALTLLSDILTINAVPSQAGFINTIISLSVIAATTYLALKIETEKEETYGARSQLAHIARVTTLGEMATSIAHQINQPLAAMEINGNACMHWLDAKPPNLGEARRNLVRIVEDAARASEIIVQVRNLTKGSPPERNSLDINEIILSTLVLVDREIQQNQISLQTHLSKDVPAIQGDRVQLQQVILNLLLNAIDAINSVPAGSRTLVISSASNDPKSVRISIQDSGVGFAPENLDRLFDAFYTTKRDGMGMGLAISRSIVETHGGRIWATPAAPNGAIFQFTLSARG